MQIYKHPDTGETATEAHLSLCAGARAAVLRKSSLEASQGQETAREDQGRSGEAQGSESRLPSSSKDGR